MTVRDVLLRVERAYIRSLGRSVSWYAFDRCYKFPPSLLAMEVGVSRGLPEAAAAAALDPRGPPWIASDCVTSLATCSTLTERLCLMSVGIRAEINARLLFDCALGGNVHEGEQIGCEVLHDARRGDASRHHPLCSIQRHKSVNDEKATRERGERQTVNRTQIQTEEVPKVSRRELEEHRRNQIPLQQTKRHNGGTTDPIGTSSRRT
eukprot:GHVU01204345.1.p1 GENE.GHVU01204345.1~~GHVU01204345.1.p1  ORF type:complete len:207 (+),score=21.12 GHVU01204345.1:251-871(+)